MRSSGDRFKYIVVYCQLSLSPTITININIISLLSLGYVVEVDCGVQIKIEAL